MKKDTYEVENLARDDEVVATVHHLLDIGDIVPEVDVENVDVGGAEAFEAALHGEVERLDVVAGVVDLLLEGFIDAAEVVRVLQRNHEHTGQALAQLSNLPWS